MYGAKIKIWLLLYHCILDTVIMDVTVEVLLKSVGLSERLADWNCINVELL